MQNLQENNPFYNEIPHFYQGSSDPRRPFNKKFGFQSENLKQDKNHLNFLSTPIENPINCSKELSDFFNFIINCETKLENLKKDLSLRPDFNLVDLFMFFDKEKKGFCDQNNFIEVMKELKIKWKSKDLARLFRRFDRNEKGFLRFAEFCDCFCPVSKESFEILNQRKPINNEEKFRMKEVS